MKLRTWNRLIAVGGAIALVVAACGDDDSPGDAAVDETDAATTDPSDDGAGTSDATTSADGAADPGWPTDYDPDGALTIALGSPPQGLDPDVLTTGSMTYLGPMYDRLTRVNDDFEVEPMLATSWEFSDDGSYLEMSLRDDVSFHDGTPFTAEVVKANIERSKSLEGSLTAAELEPVDSVEVIDEHTVRVNLVEGRGAELPVVLDDFAGMMINPAAFERDDFATVPFDGAGSGPYRISDFTADVSQSLVAAQEPGEHWDAGAGLLSELTFTYVETSPQRINAVRAGDVDLSQITGPDVAQALDLASSDEFGGREVTLATAEQVFLMRATQPPLDNPELREAIRYAIDKEAIATGLYDGTCSVASQFYPEDHWAYNPDLEGTYEHDPDRARELVAESGVADPSFTVTHMPLYAQLAQAVQAQLGEVGIDVELSPLPVPDYVSQWGTGDLTAAASVMTAGVHPSTFITQNLLGGNEMIPEEDRGPFEELADQAADVSLSQEEQAELYGEFSALLDEQSYFAPVCHSKQFWFERAGSVGGLDQLKNTFAAGAEPRFLYAPN